MGKIKIEATIGYRSEQDGKAVDYEGGSTLNGTCYKDEKAFKNKKGVCYISEFDLEEFEDNCKELAEKLNNGELTAKEYEEDRDFLLSHLGWTYGQILDLVGGKGFEKVAQYVFDMVDWQSPESFWREQDFEENDLETFSLTWDMVERVWGITRNEF